MLNDLISAFKSCIFTIKHKNHVGAIWGHPKKKLCIIVPLLAIYIKIFLLLISSSLIFFFFFFYKAPLDPAYKPAWLLTADPLPLPTQKLGSLGTNWIFNLINSPNMLIWQAFIFSFEDFQITNMCAANPSTLMPFHQYWIKFKQLVSSRCISLKLEGVRLDFPLLESKTRHWSRPHLSYSFFLFWSAVRWFVVPFSAFWVRSRVDL